jgi:hypothetical protein
MSDNGPPEKGALQELETLVQHLAAELANFRRRALTAESKLKEVEGHEGGAMSLELVNRCSQLERENERLQSKLEAATARAKQMLDRVRFLRQQAQASATIPSGDR